MWEKFFEWSIGIVDDGLHLSAEGIDIGAAILGILIGGDERGIGGLLFKIGVIGEVVASTHESVQRVHGGAFGFWGELHAKVKILSAFF